MFKSLSFKGKVVLVLFFAVGVILGVVIFKMENKTPKQEVAGTETQNDPNHPVEIYYGSPAFQDLDSMISDLAITIYPEDKTEAIPIPGMGIGSKISITRATPVKVTDAKKPTTYRTWENTVGDLLKEKGITLLGQDSASPDLGTSISYNMTVTITRVAEVEVKEIETIDYRTIKKNDNTLEKGNSHVEQKGIDGEKVVTYKVKRIDGEEVSKTIIDTQITKQPQNEILVIGTKIIVYGTGKVSWYPSSAMAAKNLYYAASHTLPKGTVIWLVNTANGKGVRVVVLDYMENPSRLLDISPDAFCAIGQLSSCDDNKYILGVLDASAQKYYPPLNL